MQPVFDNTGNEADKQSFENGLRLATTRAANRRSFGRTAYPHVHPAAVDYVESDPMKIPRSNPEERIDREFVQLVDLLLGSCREAFAPRSSGKPGRLVLAREVATTLKQLWEGRWGYYARRARSFTITVWPNEVGLPYNPRLPAPALEGTQAPLVE